MFKALRNVFSGKETKVKERPATEVSVDAPLPATDKPRIRDKYPDVSKIAINLSSRAPFEKTEPTIRGFSMGPDAHADFVFRCKNTECVGGGFDLTSEIVEMLDSGEQNRHGRRVCKGWDGKDNVGHQRCYYELNFVINVSYN